MLGKEKGADRKMRLFQGIDSVTAMVQRGWGAVESRGEGGPTGGGGTRDKWKPGEGCGLQGTGPAPPPPPGFQAVALRTPERWRQGGEETGAAG